MPAFLSIVWFKIYPAEFGGQKGTALFNKYLSHHYPVDCLCSSDNRVEKDTGLTIMPLLPAGKLQFINPFAWQKIKACVKKKKYTHVIIEYPYYGLAGALLKKRGVTYILHTHNIEAQRFRNLGKWWWRLLGAYERWSMKKANMVLFKTEEDQQWAQDHYQVAPGKCYILPYGVKKRERRNKKDARALLEKRHQISPGEKILLFAGTLDYLPNAKAVDAIYHQLEPVLAKSLNYPYKILITGRNQYPQFQYLKQLRNVRILQIGYVKDITTYFEGADLFINPVLNTHGIQTKVLDALSYNCPVIIFEASGKGLPYYLLNKKVFKAHNGDYTDFANKVTESFLSDNTTPDCFFIDYGWEKNLERLLHHMSKIEIL